MAEPSVPVPVSLIEALDDAYRGDGSTAFGRLLDNLCDLLPQDSYSEACCSRPDDPNWHTVDGSHVVPPDIEEDTLAAPPSITDMAPGTTFTAQYRAGVFHGDAARWRKLNESVVVLASSGTPVLVTQIDPSTIRDVTPPSSETER